MTRAVQLFKNRFDPLEKRLTNLPKIAFAFALWACITGCARQAPSPPTPVHRNSAPLFHPGLANTLLEGKERDAWQKPDKLIKSLKIKLGMTVADVGSGSGYLLPHLSKAVGPSGKVFAEEVQEEFMAPLQHRADQLKNVTPILGSEKDARLPLASCDLFVLLTVYHEVEDGAAFLKDLRRFAKPGARLAVIDFDPTRKGPHPAPEGHSIRETTVLLEARQAGWKPVERYQFLGTQLFLVFKQ